MPDTVQILLDCWQFQPQQVGLKLYGYVILENHLHFIDQSTALDKCFASFKAFAARRIINHLQENK
ncbi:hypothetical protein ACH50O_07010 [Methylomonas sp. 2BW1-5-20]|uniref:hypothetical protein n=1 Tax=Methylomonas sp. 2BW1-5-20 TaxID=3376686 RepID=UPI00404DF195